jgi:hypothetical protein
MIIMANRIIIRIDNDTTSVVPFMIAQGIADSMVATGQRRQKYSGNDVLRKYGTATTSPKKTAYLTNLVHPGIWNFT